MFSEVILSKRSETSLTALPNDSNAENICSKRVSDECDLPVLVLRMGLYCEVCQALVLKSWEMYGANRELTSVTDNVI